MRALETKRAKCAPQRRLGIAALALALAFGATGRAAAQDGAALDLYVPSVSPEGGFALDRPATRAHLSPSAQLHLDYANDPLVYETTAGDTGAERVALVSDQFTGHLGVALGLSGRFLVYAGLPVHLVMEGERLGSEPTATGFGGGDLAFGGRVDIEGGGAALQITITLPTAESGHGAPGVAGDSGATVEPEIVGEIGVGPLRLVANLGIRLRGDIALAGITLGDALTYGVGLVAPIVADRFDLHAEVHGASRLDDVGARGSSPIEALAGPKLRVATEWTVGAAGGLGLTRGYGAPDARVVALVGWTGGGEPARPVAQAPAPEPVREATETIVPPAPPPSPEPIAPTVDPATLDGDGDGVSNLDDRCPDLPGHSDGGCPKHIAFDADRGAVVLHTPIGFRGDSAEPRRTAEDVLDEIAWFIRSRPDLHVRFEAHVPWPGARDRALALSVARAVHTATWIVEHGVARDRLEAYGCGASRPLVTASDRRAAQNERVEVYVVLPLPPRGMRSTVGCMAGELPRPPPPDALKKLEAQPVAPPTPPTPKPATPPPPPTPATPPPTPATPKPPTPPPAAPVAASPPAAPAVGAAAMTGAALAATLAQSPGADHDGDGIANAGDACPIAPGAVAEKGCPVGHRVDPGADRFELKKRVRFGEASAELDAGSDPWLAEIAATLRANPGMKVRIESHVAERSDAAASLALTQKRAAAMRAWLAAHGAAATRMTAYGCGQTHPVAPNNVPWGQKKNDRVEIVVLDPTPAAGVASSAGCVPAE